MEDVCSNGLVGSPHKYRGRLPHCKILAALGLVIVGVIRAPLSGSDAPKAPQSVISIYGQVLRQGTYAFDPSQKLTVSQAIMQVSGGVGPYADMKRVRLTRVVDGKTNVFEIDLREIVNGHPETDRMLKANDKIIVVEKWLTSPFIFLSDLPKQPEATLPAVHLDGVTVQEAVDEIAKRLAQLDPQLKGLKIEVKHTEFSARVHLNLDLPKTTMAGLLGHVAFQAQLEWRVEGSTWVLGPLRKKDPPDWTPIRGKGMSQREPKGS